MSFGFSVGDFIACLTLIKDISDALNNSTGSVSDVKAVLSTLKSLESALVTAEVVHQQWERFDMQPVFKASSKPMIDGIRNEREQCKALLSSFVQLLSPYTDALIDGNSNAIVRQVRKLKWLSRKDDIEKFQRDLDGHMKALQIYNDCLLQIHMSITAQSTVQIFSSIASLQASIAAMSTAIMSSVHGISPTLGYPWETSASLTDSVLLLDAVGRKAPLPMMLLSSPKDLHAILRIMYRNMHGSRKILRKEYTITDEEADGILINEKNWNSVIRQGQQLTLNMVFSAGVSWDVHRCPHCNETSRGNTLPEQRKRCHKCLLTYRVFDKERVVEEPEHNDSTVLSLTENANSSDNTLSSIKKFPGSATDIEGREDRRDNADSDLMFKSIHYHREVLIVRKTTVTVETIEFKEEIPQLEISNLPPLHMAAATDKPLDIRSLLSQGADVNEALQQQALVSSYGSKYFNVRGCSPLHLACIFGKTRAIHALLAAGANIDSADASSTTPLQYAIFGSNPDRTVHLLLRREADSNHRDDHGYTPFLYCCAAGLPQLTEHFIDAYGANVNDTTPSGESPLYLAVQSGDVSVVEILLEWKSDPKIQNKDPKWSPLHLAAWKSLDEMADLLLSADHDLAAPDKDGDTPLHLAIMAHNLDMTKKLLSLGSDVEARNGEGYTALLTALNHNATNQNDEIVILLIDRGADLTARNEYGHTLLHLSVLTNHTFTKLLVEKGVNINAVEKKSGGTVLNFALEYSIMDTAKLEVLLPYCQHLVNDTFTDLQISPLASAVCASDLAVVGLLLEHGADIHGKDVNGAEAIFYAVYLGKEECTRFLLERGADVHATENNGVEPIFFAAYLGHVACAKVLLEYGASMDATIEKNGLGLLATAARFGQVDVARFLIDNGVDVNTKATNADGELMTPLMFSVHGGYEKLTTLLLTSGADVKITSDGIDAFRIALWNNSNQNIALALLQAGADTNLPTAILSREDWDGWTPLHHCISSNCTEILQPLLDHGAHFLANSPLVSSPLHLAVKLNRLEMVKSLIVAGHPLDCRNRRGRTPLHTAASRGNFAIVDVLLDSGAHALSDTEGSTPLHLAARCKRKNGDVHLETVKMLLEPEFKLPINAKNSQGETALQIAISSKEIQIFKALLEAGADVCLPSAKQETPLHAAVIWGEVEAIELILWHGCDILSTNEDGKTPLDYALKGDIKKEVVDLLRKEVERRKILDRKAVSVQRTTPASRVV